MADTRLPATGRTPLSPSAMQDAMNRAALIDWQARLLLLNLPAQIGRFNVTYPPPPGTLPERPLGAPVPIGAENLGLGLLSTSTLLGYQRALALIRLASASTAYSGHPRADLAFWLAFLRSPKLQQFSEEITASVLSHPLPVESPIRASGVLQRNIFNFPNQEELNRLFDFGQFAELSRVNQKLAELRASRDYNFYPDEANSPATGIRQRIASIEAGIQLRPIHDARQLIAQQRYDLVRALLPLLFQEPPPLEQRGLPSMPRPSADP